jgi:methyl-accepting chemotaxis protein
VSLTARLRLMVGGAVTACLVAIIAMFTLVNSVSHQYDALLAGTVQNGQDARLMQVTFKKQVQEWKDILLRGYNPADLQKYTQQFHDQEKAVQDLTAKLDDRVTDPAINNEIRQFRDQHLALSAKYHSAYDAFAASKGTDFKAADAAVKGQDRAPTDLIDKIVSDLHAQQVRLIADQKKQVSEDELIVVVIGSILVVAVLVGLRFASRGIVRPVRSTTTVLGQIADGNLAVSMAGRYGGEFDVIKESVNTAVDDLNAGLGRVVAGAGRIAETARFVEAVGEQLMQSAQITHRSLDVIEQTVRSIDTVGGPRHLAHQIGEVRQALDAMATVTERNLRAAEDAGRATYELRLNSDRLQQVVAAYKLKPTADPSSATRGHSPAQGVAGVAGRA